MRNFSYPLLIIALIALVGANLFLGYNLFFSSQREITEGKQKVSQTGIDLGKTQGNKDNLDKNSEIKIFIVGDLMLDRGVEYMINKEGKGDFKFPFLRIADYLQKADIVFGNLEGPISNDGQKMGSIYSFRDDPRVTQGLKYAGFNILSLANNHTLDYGRKGLEDTINILKENGIDYVGAGFNEGEAFSVKIKRVKGTKVGFMAYTNLGSSVWRAGPTSLGIAWVSEGDLSKVKQDIKKAKEKVDILVVSLHSGKEYSEVPTNFQKKFDKACIDAGADVVVGEHAHVIQEVKKYKEGWIAYNLGNFIFDQKFSRDTMKGLMLELFIGNKKIERVISQEIQISDSFQPYIEKGLTPEN